MSVKPASITSKTEIFKMLPPFIEHHTDKETIDLAKGVLRITQEARALAGQFYMYRDLARSRLFIDAITGSKGQDGANIVIGSLLRTMVVSIAAIFDKDPRTNNLPKLLKKMGESSVTAHLMRFHSHYDVSPEAEISRSRLIKYRRKLNSGWVRQAADRLTHVRKTHVAHFEAAPLAETDANKAIIRDLDRVVFGVGIIIGEANVFVLGRRIDFPDLQKTMLRQSGDFRDLLIAGVGVGG